jgi:amino acid adenylation domain-containing protein
MGRSGTAVPHPVSLSLVNYLTEDPSLHPNIAHLLWRTADAEPQRIAIASRSETVDYGSLRQRAEGYAALLLDAGVLPGDRVAIFMDRGAEAAAAFFGVTAVGGISIMVNETLRPRQVEHILVHAGASVLLTSADLLARQPRRLDTSVTTLDISNVPVVGFAGPMARTGFDVAQIIYTSGSTGLPKGVTVTHGNLWAGVRAVSSYLEIGPDDRIASLLPFSFDYGFNQLLCAVSAAAVLVVERSPVPQQIAITLREQEVTVLAAVPPLWLQLLAAPAFSERPIQSIRAMTNTGGRVPIPAVHDLRRVQPQARLFLMYGLTEAFRSTYLPPDEVDRIPDSIGQAIPGAEILVVREDLTPCEAGEVGELVHRGPTVTLGYWADREATAQVFRANPLRPEGVPDAERVVFSGDLVRRDEDGFLFYVGRRDQVIKTLGVRVSPDEVADVLYASGEVLEAVVAAEPDEARGDRIVVYVVLREGGSPERLNAFCGQEMPRYMRPARIEIRESLARTSSGKFDLRAIRTG